MFIDIFGFKSFLLILVTSSINDLMEIFNRLPAFTKSFYFIATLFFVVWMLFFDSNDVLTQYKLDRKLNDLQDQKAYYQQKIMEVKNDREELFSNNDLLEKFARERYLMKKKEEDLYIIEEEE